MKCVKSLFSSEECRRDVKGEICRSAPRARWSLAIRLRSEASFAVSASGSFDVPLMAESRSGFSEGFRLLVVLVDGKKNGAFCGFLGAS